MSVSLFDFFRALAGALRKHLNIEIGGSGGNPMGTVWELYPSKFAAHWEKEVASMPGVHARKSYDFLGPQFPCKII